MYRVFVPARGTITVKTTAAAGVALGALGPGDPDRDGADAEQQPVARGVSAKGTVTLTYKNTGAAKTLYLAVTLATRVRDATYTIAVTAR